jgi:isopentenyldiphosphate isomerase
MSASEELLNVYDASGAIVDARPRREAKASGRAVGAIHVLAINAAGLVLLQKRPRDKENGDLWDKTVGGHVSAGEAFDETAVREAREELFDDPRSGRVHLVGSEEALRERERAGLSDSIVIFRKSLQLNMRDVRRVAGGGIKNVVYHVATYLGRTDVPLEGFSPQRSEIEELRYFEPRAVDRMLAEGHLALNMAFLWLTHARALLGLLDGRTPR